MREVEDFAIGLPGGECRVPADEVVALRGVASVAPAISAVIVDRDGSIWVERVDAESGDRRIDVIADDGVYRGTLPAGTPFPAAFLSNRRFAAVVADELGLYRIVVYEITG